ncbi:hypothetical protein TWF506_003646 [Arthrobotrys conoides]|uniref:Peptidase S8/S53 domain-containing protein n=1 Tax=Arthrobotrys conoides TaxID=74498 RepID=A0AAN8RU25_9PEZI
MKWQLISTSFILLSLPATLAKPAVNRGNFRVKPRWHKSDATTAPSKRSAPDSQTYGTLKADDDPFNTYIITMKDNEKRPWMEIFDEMGFNATEKKDNIYSAHANSKSGYQNHIRSFETDFGEKIEAFGYNMRAFTMNLRESEADGLSGLEEIGIIEKDSIARPAVIEEDEYEVHNMTVGKFEKRQQQGQTIYTQRTAPWSLQRISSKNRVVTRGRRATDMSYYYTYDSMAGYGVDIYVMDTGTNVEHTDFAGRAKREFNAFQGDDGRDARGHGTHTAGTVGSIHYGVAKNANVLAMKVINNAGVGPSSAIVQAFDHAIRRHNQRRRDPNFRGSVISMSLSGKGTAESLKNIMRTATQAGIHVSIAAGNTKEDACGVWPGRYSREIPIITVGASDINDKRAGFSNFGPCVNIHAPGVAIMSTYNKGPTSTTSMQGTSMACPAVSGIIADEMLRNPRLRFNPFGMKRHLIAMSAGVAIVGANDGRGLANNGFYGTA